jgi:molybdopterin-guanine dinucleotide biosynthesis protein A
MNISAVILAGGESSRMGRDKAWLEMDGQPLITRAINTVRESGITEIFISGRAGTDYSSVPYPLAVLLDLESASGPVAGIERGLEATQAPLLLVLAVDMPRITAALLLKLARRCDPLTGVIPKLRGELEPLVAIYPKRCRFIARDCLIQCRLAARDFADACRREHAVRTFHVPHADIRCFDNWNTPSDMGGNGGSSSASKQKKKQATAHHSRGKGA